MAGRFSLLTYTTFSLSALALGAVLSGCNGVSFGSGDLATAAKTYSDEDCPCNDPDYAGNPLPGSSPISSVVPGSSPIDGVAPGSSPVPNSGTVPGASPVAGGPGSPVPGASPITGIPGTIPGAPMTPMTPMNPMNPMNPLIPGIPGIPGAIPGASPIATIPCDGPGHEDHRHNGGGGGKGGDKGGGGAGDGPFNVGPAVCQKVESLSVGQTLTLNGVTITIVELIYKDGNAGGEVVGFKVTSGAGLTYLIKASGEGYFDDGLEWVNPNGTSGPNAPGISHVTFCIGDTSNGIPDNSLGDANNPSIPRDELLEEEEAGLVE